MGEAVAQEHGCGASASKTGGAGHNRFDVQAVRAHFPVLHQEVHGRPLVYLDNGATSQKPRAVIDAVSRYYERDNANVHRGVHALSERATEAYEGARARVAGFLNASEREEIVFTRGTTESINLVTWSWGQANIAAGDEVVISTMEHHSNIIPWQLLCEHTGAQLKVIPVTDEGLLDMDAFHALLSSRTKLVAVVHLSNALGTVNPVRDIARAAHAVGAKVLVDGAQAVQHFPVDVRSLGCDFYAISGHKMFGPTGIGALWGRRELLDAMPPWQGGGEMIRTVSFEGSTFADVPHKFEAGTPNIAGAVGMGAAVDYLRGLDADGIAAHEADVLAYATEALTALGGVRIFGTAPGKGSVVSFVLDDIHAHDIGTIVDSQGVAIRVGHHCTMPLHERFGIAASARASFAMYNTRDEVDALVKALEKTRAMFA